MSLFSQPEDVEGVRVDEQTIELAARSGLASISVAAELGWRAMVEEAWTHRAALRDWLALRIYTAIGELNNLLLPPLFVLISIDLLAGSLPELATVELGGFSIVFGVTFLSEWLLGLWLARNRSAYLMNVWLALDLLSALPVATAFQVVRLTRVARLLRLAKLIRLLGRRGRRFPVAPLLRAGAVCVSILVSGAVALHAMEPKLAPSFSEALWWAATTITTVGYGDIVPVTTGGRLVGVALMVSGIGVFSYLAGVMSTTVFDPGEDEMLRSLRRLERQVERLTMALDTKPPKSLASTDSPSDA